MNTRRNLVTAAAAALVCLGATLAPSASAQPEAGYPSRAILLTVPYGPGSTSDIFTRVIGEALAVELRQPVVVENRPGAGGSLGTGQALRSTDGYNIMLVTATTVGINGTLYSNLNYKPATDISVVSVISSTPNILVTAPSPEVNDWAQFEKKMKTGTHFYSSQGSGTTQHLAAALLTQATGIKAEHVPYKDNAQITGIIGGETDFGFASVPSVLSLIKAGKLKGLAVTGQKPASQLPGVPSLSALGYPAFDAANPWYGIGVSSKTPDAVKDVLAKALVKVNKSPAVQAKLAEIGFEPMPEMTRAATNAYVESQVAFWSKLVKDSGAKVD